MAAAKTKTKPKKTTSKKSSSGELSNDELDKVSGGLLSKGGDNDDRSAGVRGGSRSRQEITFGKKKR